MNIKNIISFCRFFYTETTSIETFLTEEELDNISSFLTNILKSDKEENKLHELRKDFFGLTDKQLTFYNNLNYHIMIQGLMFLMENPERVDKSIMINPFEYEKIDITLLTSDDYERQVRENLKVNFPDVKVT